VKLFDQPLATLDQVDAVQLIGTVAEVRGLTVLVATCRCRSGRWCEVVSGRAAHGRSGRLR
jgi:hypothetical protein